MELPTLLRFIIDARYINNIRYTDVTTLKANNEIIIQVLLFKMVNEGDKNNSPSTVRSKYNCQQTNKKNDELRIEDVSLKQEKTLNMREVF